MRVVVGGWSWGASWRGSAQEWGVGEEESLDLPLLVQGPYWDLRAGSGRSDTWLGWAEVQVGAGGAGRQLLADHPPGQSQEVLRLQQENAIQTMELRNHFSLFCLHQETQLVHAYLPLTSHILGAFVSSQIQGHKEVGSRRPARPAGPGFLRLGVSGRAGALDGGHLLPRGQRVLTPGDGRGGAGRGTGTAPPPGGLREP